MLRQPKSFPQQSFPAVANDRVADPPRSDDAQPSMAARVGQSIDRQIPIRSALPGREDPLEFGGTEQVQPFGKRGVGH